MDVTLWIELILFIVLMGLSGFFSSSETALFSLSSVQLEQMRRNKNPRISLIEKMLGEPRRLIVTILIGNEFVNVAASVISAAVVIKLMGAENKYVNLFIMVPILLLFGEITPKTLAIRNNIAFASFEARPIEFFAWLIKPLRWLVRVTSDFFITLIVGKQRSRGNIVTQDMVRTLAHEAVGEGALDHVEAQFIDHIFDFGKRSVYDVMTPRSNIFFMPLNMPVQEMIKELHNSRHTKVPIYKEYDRDSIAGILHARDLLAADAEFLSKENCVEQLLRKPYFVPETKSAAKLFHTFRERKQTFALVVDEFGGITGIVTMEDLLECIFGDIPSPSDETQTACIKEIGRKRYTVDGTTTIAEFNQKIGSHLSEKWAETIGGLLLHEYGELPHKGTVITLSELRFTVNEVKDNRITRVMLEKVNLYEDEDEEEDEEEKKEPDNSVEKIQSDKPLSISDTPDELDATGELEESEKSNKETDATSEENVDNLTVSETSNEEKDK